MVFETGSITGVLDTPMMPGKKTSGPGTAVTPLEGDRKLTCHRGAALLPELSSASKA